MGSTSLDGSDDLSNYFSIAWNEFPSHLLSSLKELRDEFTDIYLLCDSGKRIFKAHKFVLAASSRIFRNIILQSSSFLPNGSTIVIYLKDITDKELENLLNFIYNGEVLVFNDQIPLFMRIAQEYEIKGLVGSSPAKHPGSPILTKGSKSKKSKRSRDVSAKKASNEILVSMKNDPQFKEVDDSYLKCDNRLNIGKNDPKICSILSKTIVDADEASSKNEVLSLKFKSSFPEAVVEAIEKVGDQFVCKICFDKSSINRCHIANHIEAQHIRVCTIRKCPYCGKEHKTRHSLTQHVSRNHKVEHRAKRFSF